MKAIYEVKYETRWNGDRKESDSVNVFATSMEKAIEKASKYVLNETYEDEKGNTLRRVYFRATEVLIVAEAKL